MHTTPKGALIRADKVAAIIGVSTKKAAELMRQMPRVNIGLTLTNPRWAVYEGDVQDWLQSRQMPADTGATPDSPRRKRRTATPRISELLDEQGHIRRRK